MVKNKYHKEYYSKWLEYEHSYRRGNIYFRLWLRKVVMISFAWGDNVLISGGFERVLKPRLRICNLWKLML